MTPENANRMATKAEMVVDRGGFRNACCDLCVRPGTDMHELISRGRTQNNDEARQASYKKEICALLCPRCHEAAHNPDIAYHLLEQNIGRYGYDRVKKAWDAVLDELSITVNIPFPNRRDSSD